MLVAMMQVGDGSYFIRAVGPDKTMSKWEKSFRAAVETIQKAK